MVGAGGTLGRLDRLRLVRSLSKGIGSEEEGAWMEPSLEAWQVLRDWPEFSDFLLA